MLVLDGDVVYKSYFKQYVQCLLYSLYHFSSSLFYVFVSVIFFPSQRNDVGSFGCVSSLSEGPEGGNQAEQCAA